MSLRKTLLLTIVLAALGGYLYFVDIPRDEHLSEGERLVTLPIAEIRAISLARGEDRVELQRGAGDQWDLVHPLQAIADAAAVQNLLAALGDSKIERTLPITGTLDGFGLDEPFIRIGISGAAAEPIMIAVGHTAPVGNAVYTRRNDDDAVVLVDASLRTAVDKRSDDFRDKRIFAFDDADVRRIEIHKGDRQFRVERTDADGWQVVGDATHVGDATAIQTYLSSIRSLRVATFADDAPADLAPFGLDAPRVSLRIVTANDGEHAIALGSDAPSTEVYAQIEGRTNVFTIHDWAYRNLNKGARDLRDKHLFDFDADSVHSLAVVRADGETIRLQRDAGGWNVAGGEGSAKEIEIAQYVRDMGELAGYEIVTDEPDDLTRFGLDAPLLQLSAFGEDGTQLGSVHFAKKVGEDGIHSFFAKSDQRPMVVLVRSYLFNRLDKKAADFVEATAAESDVDE